MSAPRHPRFAFEHALRVMDLPPRARLTGLALATFMHGTTGQCWPAAETTLAKVFGIGRQRLAADVASLEAAGLLDVQRRKGPRGATIYTSLAWFTDATGVIMLADGRVLSTSSARDPRGDELTGVGPGGQTSSARDPRGDELTDTDPDGQLVPFSAQLVGSEHSARDPRGYDEHHEHQNTTEGGGGGGSGNGLSSVAGAPSSEPYPTVGRVIERDEVLKTIRVLQTGIHSVDAKLSISPDHPKLVEAVTAKLAAGWPSDMLTAAVIAETCPKVVNSPSAFFAGRVAKLPREPDAAVMAKRAAARQAAAPVDLVAALDASAQRQRSTP